MTSPGHRYVRALHPEELPASQGAAEATGHQADSKLN